MTVTPSAPAALTNKDTKKVRVWQVATLYVGPYGTDAPASLTDPLDAAMSGLGFITNAGITEATGQSITDISVYEGNVVRSIITAGSYSLAAVFEQTIQKVLETFYANAAGSDGGIIFDPLKELDYFAWCLDLYDGPNNRRRVWVPNGQARRNGDVTFNKTVETGYPLLVMGFPDVSLDYDDETGAQGTVKIFDSSIAE